MYVQGQAYKECVHSVIDSVTRIDSLGRVAHLELENPSQQLEVLRFILNLVSMTIRLTLEKTAGFKNGLLNSAYPFPMIRELARVVGKIVLSFPWVMYRPLHYRLLEHDKILVLQTTCWDFDKPMSLSPEAKSEHS